MSERASILPTRAHLVHYVPDNDLHPNEKSRSPNKGKGCSASREGCLAVAGSLAGDGGGSSGGRLSRLQSANKVVLLISEITVLAL